jgi:hypothetical protein
VTHSENSFSFDYVGAYKEVTVSNGGTSIASFEYALGDTAVNHAWNAYTENDGSCTYTIAYTLYVDGSTTDIPTCFSFDDTARTFSVETSKNFHIGSYDIIIRASVGQNENDDLSFTVDIVEFYDNSAPVWIDLDFKKQTVMVGEEITFSLPLFYDLNPGSEFTISIDLEASESIFITLN